MSPAVRKPPGPSLEEMVREFVWDESVRGVFGINFGGLIAAGFESRLLAFVKSAPPIDAAYGQIEALQAERKQMWELLDECASLLEKEYSEAEVEADPPAWRANPAARMASRIRAWMEAMR